MLVMDPQTMVREAWAALQRGDTESLERAFTPDARWRAVEDGPWNCDGRSQILDVVARQLARVLSGTIEDVSSLGARAIVGFRPADPDSAPWPLDDGVRYLVLSFRDGAIAEMKGCATKADAEAYAQA